MADTRATPNCAVNYRNRFKEAVCIEADRIFDSCSDRDCLSDLPVYFTAAGQRDIDRSPTIKCRSGEVIYVYPYVEPVPFNGGYFSVDLALYFRVYFNCFPVAAVAPVNVMGLALHTKKVILFGGDGAVKTFDSNLIPGAGLNLANSKPLARVKTVDPVILGSKIADGAQPVSESPVGIPSNIAAAFDGEIITAPINAGRNLTVTMGLFSIVTLERPVQIMVPAYDYVLPEKDGAAFVAADDPCDIFNRIKFPVNEFFPDDVNEAACGNYPG